MTPPLNNNDNNMDSMSDSTTHSNSEQGDQPDNSENNGGTYAMPHTLEEAKRIQEEAERKQKEEKRKQEEAARKEKEAQEAKDKKDVETVKDIVKVHEDVFGSFHTQGEFLDQIALYANKKGISNLKLEDQNDKDKYLNVDSKGENKNRIKLQLGTQKFVVSLGKVLKDAVVTKYYFENEKDKVLDNHKAGSDDIERNWRNILKGNTKKTIITQLGYHKSGSHIHLTLIPYHTTKVPDHLPEKVNSLLASFYNLDSKNIDNLDKWDTRNIITAEQAFGYAKNFEQDLSSWKFKENVNLSGIFLEAKKMQKYVDSIAKTWNVEKSKLLKK
ncbi:BspA family leucine-rich repeat surface protein [Mycoplasmopsis agalactiae]|uniref:BspA family leucine-rich repeat surface protein n=1 Tax=Mycoplasmopsis agalactiae TaxID=2110 RepID=UPI002F3E3A80